VFAFAMLLLAAEPSWEEIFDPLATVFGPSPQSFERRREAMERRLASGGVAEAQRALRHVVAPDAAYAKLDERAREAHEAHASARARWWAWRIAYIEEFRKKRGTDPGDYPTPESVNRPYLDAEKEWQRRASQKRQEIEFREWALRKLADAIRALPEEKRGRPVAAAQALLRDAQRRVGAAQLLAAVDPALLAPALPGERDSRFLALLLDLGAGDPAPYLEHPAWQVRAAAIRRLAAAGRRDLLEARRGKEEGRLAEDLDAAFGSPPPSAGLTTRSKRVVFVTDGAFGSAEIAAAVEALPEDARFAVIVCDEGAPALAKGLVPADAARKARARAFLEALRPVAAPNAYDAVCAALALEPDTILLVLRGPPELGLYVEPYQLGQEVRLRNRLVGAALRLVAPDAGGMRAIVEEGAPSFTRAEDGR
jgi:hypothetical protein